MKNAYDKLVTRVSDYVGNNNKENNLNKEIEKVRIVQSVIKSVIRPSITPTYQRTFEDVNYSPCEGFKISY